MKLEQFLRHHGITGNPFSEEDAQTDTVFKRRLSGDDPPSGVEQVFRQSGRSVDGPGVRRERERQDGLAASGRRRAGIVQPGQSRTSGCSSISYDDFNPYLDSCRAAMRAANMDAGTGDRGGFRTTWTPSSRSASRSWSTC